MALKANINFLSSSSSPPPLHSLYSGSKHSSLFGLSLRRDTDNEKKRISKCVVYGGWRSRVMPIENRDHLGEESAENDEEPLGLQRKDLSILPSSKHSVVALSWKRDTDKEKRISLSKCIAYGGWQAVMLIGNKDHLGEESAENEDEPLGVQKKDTNILPKPLSINDLSYSPTDTSKFRVAYKGAPGSLSEAAALKAYPLCETVPCQQIEAAFKAVELWLANKAIIPIESSVGGSLHRNYDLLLRNRLHIVGEVQMAVKLCLLGLPGVRMEDLKRVLSHPQALSQCEINLGKLGVVKENVDDTAAAAQFVVSNKLKDTGAIASAQAAEIYGLNILADGFEDDPHNNITRFLILSREPVIPRNDRLFKTSIVFTLEEGSGILFKALAVFALRNINLTKIESRPQRYQPLRAVDDSDNGVIKYFDYLFYIDFEASMAEPRAQNALGHLQEFATFLRVLGCYPVDTTL